ncbi:c-type cytochrome [Hyphomicrobium sp. 99]|uniref:c-type cytochrome n=1 Tax=Hyphomicrobium sp. 99 TaxID=1163419 RepID=UPI0005F7F40D|nr:c-type cytochrome [Hyphomicrobium sp. 99]
MASSKFAVLRCAGIIAISALVTSHVRADDGAAPSAAVAATSSAWTVPDIDKLPDDVLGKTVRYGRDLISKTSSLIGPEVADASRRFAGNNLDCQSCHINAGTQEFGLPLVGVYADFPAYSARLGQVDTIQERIQGCMERSMNGKRLPPEGPEMTAMAAYLMFLSKGRPVGGKTPGRGSGRMAQLDRAADPAKGRTVYANNCAVCHGANGEGQRVGKVGDAKGYTFPPLWGPDSFNDGAGMDRLIEAANFIHSNMPQGTTWKAPALSPEDAWDVAAYIDSQPRPSVPDLDRDYPNRIEKPVDTAYGPYADGFSAEQHKYGPFAPIEAAIKKLEETHDAQR